jgi:hypothetical protein
MLGKLFGIMAGVGLIAALTVSEEQLQAFGTFIKEKVIPGFKTFYEEGIKPFYENLIKPVIDWVAETGLPTLGTFIVDSFQTIRDFFVTVKEGFDLMMQGDLEGGLLKFGEALLKLVSSTVDTIFKGVLNLFGADIDSESTAKDFLSEKFANFVEESKQKLMSFFGGLLPDPDSWIGRNLIPDGFYEFFGLPATTPQEPEPVIEAEETVDEFGDIGRDQPPAAPAPRATVSAEDPLAIEMESFTEGQRATTTAAQQREMELDRLNQGAVGRGGGRAELRERLIPAGESAENIPPLRFLAYHEAGYDVVKGQEGYQASIETPDGSTKTFYEDGSYTVQGVEGKAFFDAEGNLVKTQLPTLGQGLTRTQFADGTVENQFGAGPVEVTADEQGNVLDGSVTFSGLQMAKQRDGSQFISYGGYDAEGREIPLYGDEALQEMERVGVDANTIARAKAFASGNKSLNAPIGQASKDVAAAASGPTVVAPQTTVAPVTNQSSVTNINNATTIGSTGARPTEPSFMRMQNQLAPSF